MNNANVYILCKINRHLQVFWWCQTFVTNELECRVKTVAFYLQCQDEGIFLKQILTHCLWQSFCINFSFYY